MDISTNDYLARLYSTISPNTLDLRPQDWVWPSDFSRGEGFIRKHVNSKESAFNSSSIPALERLFAIALGLDSEGSFTARNPAIVGSRLILFFIKDGLLPLSEKCDSNDESFRTGLHELVSVFMESLRDIKQPNEQQLENTRRQLLSKGRSLGLQFSFPPELRRPYENCLFKGMEKERRAIALAVGRKQAAIAIGDCGAEGQGLALISLGRAARLCFLAEELKTNDAKNEMRAAARIYVQQASNLFETYVTVEELWGLVSASAHCRSDEERAAVLANGLLDRSVL